METITAKSTSKAQLMRILLQIRIAKMYIQEVGDEGAPLFIMKGLGQVFREIEILERKILHVTDEQFPWLRQEVEKDKLWDIAALTDLLVKIGNETDQEIYEQFTAMLVHSLNTVYYSQSRRRKLHMSKYKALFDAINEEVIADTNHVAGRFYFHNGSLLVRTSLIEQQQIKS